MMLMPDDVFPNALANTETPSDRGDIAHHETSLVVLPRQKDGAIGVEGRVSLQSLCEASPLEVGGVDAERGELDEGRSEVDELDGLAVNSSRWDMSRPTHDQRDTDLFLVDEQPVSPVVALHQTLAVIGS
jgi:hypothetical protein